MSNPHHRHIYGVLKFKSKELIFKYGTKCAYLGLYNINNFRQICRKLAGNLELLRIFPPVCPSNLTSYRRLCAWHDALNSFSYMPVQSIHKMQHFDCLLSSRKPTVWTVKVDRYFPVKIHVCDLGQFFMLKSCSHVL